MRLSLDIARGCLLLSPASSDALTRLYRTLGDAPLEIQIIGGQILPQEPTPDSAQVAPGELQLIARPNVGGASILSGAVEVSVTPPTAAPQMLSLGEDWKSAALMALFTSDSQSSVTLQLQLRWRNGGGDWLHSRFLDVVVENSLFVEDAFPSVDIVEDLYRLPYVDSYVGVANSLEAINGTILPNGFEFLVTIELGGEPSASQWQVVKPAALATNVAAGVVRLLDNSAHLLRIGGL